jgi:hypothetical protein
VTDINTGHWRPFSFQENTATVTKAADSSNVSLSIAVAGNIATWSIASNAQQFTISENFPEYPLVFMF